MTLTKNHMTALTKNNLEGHPWSANLGSGRHFLHAAEHGKNNRENLSSGRILDSTDCLASYFVLKPPMVSMRPCLLPRLCLYAHPMILDSPCKPS